MFSSLELHTEDRLQYNYYPATSNILSFQAKAPNDLHIILTKTNYDSTPCYEIFFGGWKNTKSVIRKNLQQPDVAEVATPNILDPNGYNGFWIRWDYDSGVLTAGIQGETKPLLKYHDPLMFRIRYFGLCTGWGAKGHWFIDTVTTTKSNNLFNGPPVGIYPPINPQPSFNPAFDLFGLYGISPPTNKPQWIPDHNGFVPSNAVVGGYDINGEALYVIRAYHNGSLIPGKLPRSHGGGFVPWGGRENSKFQYEVLCNCKPQWVPANGDNLLPRAFIAGHTDNGEPLYIGRAHHEESLTPGKIQPSHKTCNISFAGQEIAKNSYEILIFDYNPVNSPKWIRSSDGNVPKNAIIGGTDLNGEPLYVIRAKHEGSLTPGKLPRSYGRAFVAWGGQENSKYDYEVLCDCTPRWIQASDGYIPPGALAAGRSESGETLYIGRASHDGTTTIGKVQASHRVCYISYGGAEIEKNFYEILTL